MDRNAFLLTRRIRLKSDLTDAQEAQLAIILNQMHLDQSILKRSVLMLKYSAAEIQWPAIEQALQLSQLIDGGYWLNRLRMHWYRFVDENARTNAQSNNAHCCNKAPVVIKKR